MALKKKKEYKNGTSAEYHRIHKIVIEPFQETKVNRAPDFKSHDPKYTTEHKSGYQIKVYVDSYASEQVRLEDSSLSLNSFVITKNFDKDQFNSTDIFTQAYEILKEQAEFAEAKDC